MAWLESKGGLFRIRFRYAGRKCLYALRCKNAREAEDSLRQFEENSRLIDRGILDSPPRSVDPGLYILSGGKRTERPGNGTSRPKPTIGSLFDAYESDLIEGVKEDSTRMTERVHLNHLRRLLGSKMPLADITPKLIQEFVDARLRESGRFGRTLRPRTVKKELATFRYVWNQFGIPREFVSASAPTSRVIFTKERVKPPFQTREQIERQIARNRLTPTEQAELWASLFLTVTEVEELLDCVKAKDLPPYVYPMITLAAHTGPDGAKSCGREPKTSIWIIERCSFAKRNVTRTSKKPIDRFHSPLAS